jgi:hypothetical protein
LPQIRFPFPLGKGLGVRFLASTFHVKHSFLKNK